MGCLRGAVHAGRFICYSSAKGKPGGREAPAATATDWGLGVLPARCAARKRGHQSDFPEYPVPSSRNAGDCGIKL